MAGGQIVYQPVAEAQGLAYTPLESLLLLSQPSSVPTTDTKDTISPG